MPRPKLEDLITLGLDAGREIMNVRAAGFDTQTKLDGSLVTLADQRAEEIIETGLTRLAPGVPMLGEEAASGGRVPELGAQFFCVDPLDGTRGFTKGGDEFTVNIALIEDGAPVMGVVYAPATGELYAGEPGRAFSGSADIKTHAPAPLSPISVAQSTPPRARVVASDHSGRDERTARFVEGLAGVMTHASSSIKFCRVAEGAADIYPRFGDVCEWDAAAGHAILKAAGGDIMTLDGAALRYGRSGDNFLIHGFVAYANADLRIAILDALTR